MFSLSAGQIVQDRVKSLLSPTPAEIEMVGVKAKQKCDRLFSLGGRKTRGK